MTVINEGDLSFRFGEKWRAFKLDDHSFYRERLEKIDGTKAVDILGILDNRELYFIEIKDFRKHRIENKDRLLKGELFIEVAQKIRDSIACIVCAHRTENNVDLWKNYAELLYNSEKKVKVVLWMENDPAPTSAGKQKQKASTNIKLFKQKMVWLTTHVFIYNVPDNGLPDMSVVGIPEDSSCCSE